jgi:hypothetical protein
MKQVGQSSSNFKNKVPIWGGGGFFGRWWWWWVINGKPLAWPTTQKSKKNPDISITYDMKSNVSVSADISSSTWTPLAPSFLQSSVRVPILPQQQ